MNTLLLIAALASQGSAADPERALRCAPVADAPLYARHAGPLAGPLTGGPAPAPAAGQALPALMVEGWSTSAKPLDAALRELVSEAGLDLNIEGSWSPVSWTGSKAPLTSVVDALVRQGGGRWTFNGSTLNVSRPQPPAPWSYSRPANRDMALALLDILRGHGAENVALGANAVTFDASPTVIANIREKVGPLSEVLSFDVLSLRVRPEAGRYDWSRLASTFEVTSSTPNEAGGKFVLSGADLASVRTFFASQGDVRASTPQTVAGPEGWALDVPLAQCDGGDDQSSVLFKPRRNGAQLDVRLERGGSAESVTALNPGSVVVIASSRPRAGWIDVVVFRPRIVSAR